VIDNEKVQKWLGVGAKPSDTVQRLLDRQKKAPEPAEA
jgi:ribosomal protein S16